MKDRVSLSCESSDNVTRDSNIYSRYHGVEYFCKFKPIIFTVLLVAVFQLSSCGKLFNDKTETIIFDSLPQGASVIVNGQKKGVTPVSIALEKNKDFNIVLTKSGYNSAELSLVSKAGRKWVGLDCLGLLSPFALGSLATFGVDYFSKGWRELKNNFSSGEWRETKKPRQFFLTFQKETW